MKYAKCDLNILVRSNNAGKGSRQNGSVTLGKGLALRAGSVGLRLRCPVLGAVGAW